MRALLGTPLLLVPLLLACTAEPPASATNANPAGLVATAAVEPTSDAELLTHGEYLIRITGCNDCHTPGYPEAGGDLPKSDWLMGSPVGWHGPWGTTYAANLRIKLQDMDEAGWLEYSGSLHTRPPMPDFAVRAMTERDRLAIYRFIKSLGPGGVPAPAYMPPGEKPTPPYLDWVLPPPPTAATPAG